MTMPWICATQLALAAAGMVVARGPSPDRARRTAVCIAGLATLLGLAAALWIHGGPEGRRYSDPLALAWIGEARPLFALDALNAVLLPFSALVVWAMLLGAPRGELSSRRAGAALAQLAATWTLLCAQDLGVMAIAWTLGLVPALPSGDGTAGARQSRRLYAVYLFGSAVLLTAGALLVVAAAARAGVAAPASLPELEAIGVERLRPWGALPLLLVAVVIRKGAFPFQSWIPALSEQLGTSTLALLVTPQVGAFVLVRVAIPLFPGAMAEALPIVGRVALLAALYGALLGIAARSLRGAFGWLVVSQSALVLVGLECVGIDGIAGGMTLWISVGLALTGFALAIAAVEARMPRATLDRFGGLDARAPWLGAVFLVLGLASVGLPGTLGFVAEDMLVHGVLESYPGIGVAIVLATAANGYSVLRAYFRTFCGPARPSCTVADALPRERAALGVLAAILVVFGLFPQPLVSTRVGVANRIAERLALAGASTRAGPP